MSWLPALSSCVLQHRKAYCPQEQIVANVPTVQGTPFLEALLVKKCLGIQVCYQLNRIL